MKYERIGPDLLNSIVWSTKQVYRPALGVKGRSVRWPRTACTLEKRTNRQTDRGFILTAKSS